MMKIIAVHNGEFHTDDVFAVAILKLIYPNLIAIRTRDKDKLKEVDARVDVGFKYDPSSGDYDHHQKEGAGKRKNGVPYASAGLIWKHFGKKLARSDFVWGYIDEKLIQHIDSNDVGLKTYKFDKVDPYKLDDIISVMNPIWPDDGSGGVHDKMFDEAVNLARTILRREIEKSESHEKSREIIRDQVKDKNQDYIILDEYAPWKDYIINSTKIKFVVYKAPRGDYWVLRAVPKNVTSFENRKDLPKAWAGLNEKDLAKVTGVEDARFCHNNLFIASANSKKGILKLLEIALDS